jgi:hypothetical protein
MDTLAQSPLIQVGILILGLAIVWIVIRFVLKLAMKILFTGCALILLFGIIIFVIRSFGS